MRHAVPISAPVLSAMAAEVVLHAAVDPVDGADLGDLALAQAGERRGERRGDLGAERGGDLGRAGEQEVADDDGEQVAPAAVHADDVAPADRLVHDVVVVERGEVHELDRDAAEQGVLSRRRSPSRVGRGERQRGAQALASRADEVGGDLVDERLTGKDDSAQRSPRDGRGRTRRQAARRGPGRSSDQHDTPPPSADGNEAALSADAARSRGIGPASAVGGGPPDRLRAASNYKGVRFVREVHRPGAAGRRPGPGRGPDAQPQLHRHRAHPARPHPRGRGRRRQGARVPRHLPGGGARSRSRRSSARASRRRPGTSRSPRAPRRSSSCRCARRCSSATTTSAPSTSCSA